MKQNANLLFVAAIQIATNEHLLAVFFCFAKQFVQTRLFGKQFDAKLLKEDKRKTMVVASGFRCIAIGDF